MSRICGKVAKAPVDGLKGAGQLVDLLSQFVNGGFLALPVRPLGQPDLCTTSLQGQVSMPPAIHVLPTNSHLCRGLVFGVLPRSTPGLLLSLNIVRLAFAGPKIRGRCSG